MLTYSLKRIDDDIIPKSEIIFDANALSYKTIITKLYSLRKHKDLSYKIRPQHSKFIIGSDDSINRGEVIEFNNN